MKINKKRHFNMLEVVLAITVIGAGLTLLLVLFPVATRTANETVDNNYIPMVVTSFVTYINANVDYYAGLGNPKFWPSEELLEASSEGTTDDLPAIPDIDEIKATSGFSITHISSGASLSEDQEPVSLYECKNSNGEVIGYCAVVRGGFDAEDDKYTLVDFTAYVKLERISGQNLEDEAGQKEIGYYSKPFWISPPSTSLIPDDATGNQTFQDGFARIKLTVFWPLEVSPSARKSRVFIIEKAWLQ